VSRLTDLIREQANREAVGIDSNGSARSMGLICPPIPSSPMSLPTAAETDWYQRACIELHGIKRAVQAKQPWKIDELVRIASGIATSIGTNDKLLQTVLQQDQGDYLVKNALSVAIVSVKIAEALRYESANLEQIALAGLLHDLGMFALPDSLVYKTGPLIGEELQQIRKHPQHGANLIKDLGGSYPWVERVILQEHERWDGSGYPNQLIGDKIDEMALVVGLADVYDALMSSRPYRSGVSPHRAIRALLVNGKTVFPHRVLKALVDQLSIYPLGTTVRLNTGETGVVFQLNRQYPMRPILQVSQQAAVGRVPVAKMVDLRAETSVHIVEVVSIG
jgi:HD-GYP domain-containing protein (c-di-GMP phosphodiesterase class II)